MKYDKYKKTIIEEDIDFEFTMSINPNDIIYENFDNDGCQIPSYEQEENENIIKLSDLNNDEFEKIRNRWIELNESDNDAFDIWVELSELELTYDITPENMIREERNRKLKNLYPK